MSDEKFDQLLRGSTRPVPPAPLGEAAKIWRAIDGSNHNNKRHLFFSWKVLLPVTLTAVATALVLKAPFQNERDREIEAILTAAISFEAQSGEDMVSLKEPTELRRL